MFEWVRVTAGLTGPPTSLQVLHYEVARLHQRVDGGWLATTRRNLSHELQRTHACQSFESGRAGCEAWACRHEKALLAWAQAKHEEWEARQRWRGGPGRNVR